MPSTQPLETLIALGVIAGVTVFLIGLALLGVLLFIETIILQWKKLFVFLRQQNK